MKQQASAAIRCPDPSDLRAAIEGSPEQIAIIAATGTVHYANPGLRRNLGGTPRTVRDLVHPDDSATLLAAVESLESIAVRTRDAGGAWHRRKVTVTPLPRRGGRARAVFFFASKAGSGGACGIEDLVTGLPGRQVFLRQLDRSLRRARFSNRHLFAVLVADLDGFKLVNDSLGRERGDELLRAVGLRLMDTVRPGDKVAQLSVDEFAILVDRIPTPDLAFEISRRVQLALAMPFVLGAQEVFVQAGIGVALGSPDHVRGEDVLQDAATALHRAKARGPGQIELFDQGMRKRALARLQLETDLRRGLERDEFILHYQPILALESGKVVGFEGLLRWQHPERGLLPPLDFIPLAELTGLIVPISTRVLQRACLQMRAWQLSSGMDDLSLSINFTAAQFGSKRVHETLLQALGASGLAASRMVVEITESVLMTDFEATVPVLRHLRARGVRIHLDDFGTGYSSLSYLSRLPVDAIKIDRSFVGQLDEREDAAVLVRAIVDLARSLGKEAIGEGIEKPSQADKLRALGCGLGQGYLFSRPLEPDAAGEWLARSQRESSLTSDRITVPG